MKLYRGFADVVQSGTIKNNYRTTSRNPKDTPTNIHYIADKWFEEKFGIKARSETIFCSTDIEQAGRYGKLFEVLFGDGAEYKLIFSKDVYDFTEIMCEVEDRDNSDCILAWLEKKQYQMVSCIDELPREFHGEVMVDCEVYDIVEFKE